MDLQLQEKTFAVGGASSGLGLAIAERLIAEGARVVGIARGMDGLEDVRGRLGQSFEPYPADLSDVTAIDQLAGQLIERNIMGCVLNSGGPPSGGTLDFGMSDWDEAYASTLRWKVQLVRKLLPMMKKRGAGELLFVESVSIKQPIDNLVLSNVFRAGVAGLVKTLSREVGKDGVRVNIIAPGYHATPRIKSVLEKAAELQGVSKEEITGEFAREVPNGRIGEPANFGATAAFLLSPLAEYINGQTVTVDGGLTRHLTG